MITIDNELGTEMVQKYLLLRKSKLLGPIWKTGEFVEFSDIDDILDRRVLPIGEYRKLISYWYPTNQKEVTKRELINEENIERIGPKRESRRSRLWNQRYYS